MKKLLFLISRILLAIILIPFKISLAILWIVIIPLEFIKDIFFSSFYSKVYNPEELVLDQFLDGEWQTFLDIYKSIDSKFKYRIDTITGRLYEGRTNYVIRQLERKGLLISKWEWD